MAQYVLFYDETESRISRYRAAHHYSTKSRHYDTSFFNLMARLSQNTIVAAERYVS